MTKLAIALLSPLLALAACSSGHEAGKAGIEVDNAWVRLPALPDRPGAAYFTLRNNGPATVLTGLQSPRVQRIELHDSQMGSGTMAGMMDMAPVSQVAIPQQGIVKFEPAGRHAMLFGIDPKAQPGDTLVLTLSFRDGRKIDAQAQLVTAGSPPPREQ